MPYLIQADLLAQEWGRLIATTNGWDTDESDTFTESFAQSFNRALNNGNLKARDRFGLVTCVVDIPQNHLFIDLKDFCDWGKTGTNLGIPPDEYELATLLKIEELTESSKPWRLVQILPPASTNIQQLQAIAQSAPHLFFSGEMDGHALPLTPSIVITAAPRLEIEQLPESGKIPASRCATPEQLIVTFGNLTGMSKQWFRDLKGTPGLKAARQYSGRSGKSSDQSNQPLFCPTLVMLWLCEDSQKKGFKKLSKKTGLMLLRRDYPESYEANAPYIGE